MNSALLILALLFAQAGPVITVSVDRGSYSLGEQATITIHVNAVDDIALNSTWLWLYIDKPDGRNAFFAQLDAVNQTVVWNIPTNATEGTYTVTVTWDHHSAQTGFTVTAQPIPEFPFAFAVLIVAFTVAVSALSWRKTSARPGVAADDSRTHSVC